MRLLLPFQLSLKLGHAPCVLCVLCLRSSLRRCQRICARSLRSICCLLQRRGVLGLERLLRRSMRLLLPFQLGLKLGHPLRLCRAAT